MPLSLDELLSSVNIADLLDEDDLQEIGSKVFDEYTADLKSREPWETSYDEYLDLALQVTEDKSFPWEGAANVKYPLMSTAAMQFGARAYPALISGTKIVKGKTAGFDPTGQKRDAAIRVGKHMSYQLIEEMEDWEEEMDKLCITLPITGCMFKKTYFSPIETRNVSELVYPKELVVNYWAKTLETAKRKTHVLELTPNDIYERIEAGIYRDVELGSVQTNEDNSEEDNRQGLSPPPNTDDSAPRKILEQHRWHDLDGDGYEEPYITTIDKDTREVLRIVARFDEDGIRKSESGRLMRIVPVEYFTKFSFVPNPDGGFYDIGFGTLLSPINDTINTVINQLLDSGTMSTLQAGFVSRGIRIKGGNQMFKPGEWKTVNATGDDLLRGIVPLPTKEPSNVLFQLLGMMIDGAQKLSSVTDMLMGENPGQNQPATTTMAVLEQGLKVFSSIHKRNHRSLKKEFKKLYRLNRLYLPPESYFEVLDLGEEGAAQIFQNDYSKDITNIQPYSDPNVSSESQRLLKAQGLLELIPLGTVNPAIVTQRVLIAQEQDNIEELMTMPPPQPNPEVEQKAQELQMQERKDMDLSHQAWEELDIKRTTAEATALKQIADAEAAEIGEQLEQYKAIKESMKEDDLANMKVTQLQAAHEQKLAHAAQLHAQKLEMEKQEKRQANKGSGEDKDVVFTRDKDGKIVGAKVTEKLPTEKKSEVTLN